MLSLLRNANKKSESAYPISRIYRLVERKEFSSRIIKMILTAQTEFFARYDTIILSW